MLAKVFANHAVSRLVVVVAPKFFMMRVASCSNMERLQYAALIATKYIKLKKVNGIAIIIR